MPVCDCVVQNKVGTNPFEQRGDGGSGRIWLVYECLTPPTRSSAIEAIIMISGLSHSLWTLVLYEFPVILLRFDENTANPSNGCSWSAQMILRWWGASLYVFTITQGLLHYDSRHPQTPFGHTACHLITLHNWISMENHPFVVRSLLFSCRLGRLGGNLWYVSCGKCNREHFACFSSQKGSILCFGIAKGKPTILLFCALSSHLHQGALLQAWRWWGDVIWIAGMYTRILLVSPAPRCVFQWWSMCGGIRKYVVGCLSSPIPPPPSQGRVALLRWCYLDSRHDPRHFGASRVLFGFFFVSMFPFPHCGSCDSHIFFPPPPCLPQVLLKSKCILG